MNKNELKKVLKPLIKECIREVIFEEGALSSVVSEVVKGMGQPIVETKQRFPAKQKPQYETDEQAKARLDAKKEKMMEAVGAGAYNGVNLFEGTTPAPKSDQQGQSPLSGIDPNDAGVDISSIMSKSAAILVKDGGEIMGVNYSVKVRRKDNIERVIKRFIKKCKKLGIIEEVKDRRYYTKPSEKRRRAKERAIRRRKKEERKRKK